MHAWYSTAAVCYAYLADVSTGGGTQEDEWMSQFEKSNWFRRGWTLQELIAPAIVWFFDVDWFVVGYRDEFDDPLDYGHHSDMPTSNYTPVAYTAYLPSLTCLLDTIVNITGIESAIFRTRDYHSFSVAQRMSWAASRRTTRLEDEAYCLLGLFQINMPLIYGEGRQAFARLQEEIIRRYQDQSILAWCLPSDEYSIGFSLLADSPSRFAGCRDIESCPPWARRTDVYEMTSTGLRISIPTITFAEIRSRRPKAVSNSSSKTLDGATLAVLDCHVGGKAVAIFILRHSEDRYVLQRYMMYTDPERLGKWGWCQTGELSAITEKPGLWFVDWDIVAQPCHSITLLKEDLKSKPKTWLPRRNGKLYFRIDDHGLDDLRSIEYYPKDMWKREWSQGPSLEAIDDTITFVGAVSLRGLDGVRRHDVLFEISVFSKWSLIDHGSFKARLAIDDSHEDVDDSATSEAFADIDSQLRQVERRMGALEMGARKQVVRDHCSMGYLCATIRYEPGLDLEDFSLTVSFQHESEIGPLARVELLPSATLQPRGLTSQYAAPVDRPPTLSIEEYSST